jgi:hypothetical protein
MSGGRQIPREWAELEEYPARPFYDTRPLFETFDNPFCRSQAERDARDARAARKRETLFGYPVIPVDDASSLGPKGDITLGPAKLEAPNGSR